MSGSHYAPPPHVTDNYGDDRTQYDLCPPDALHPLTDLAALRLLCDKQAEAISYYGHVCFSVLYHTGNPMTSVCAGVIP